MPARPATRVRDLSSKAPLARPSCQRIRLGLATGDPIVEELLGCGVDGTGEACPKENAHPPSPPLES